MTRMIAFFSVIAAPVAALAGDSGHSDRITWQPSSEIAVVQVANHADRITWAVAPATTVAITRESTTMLRTSHADRITWECPEAKDLVN